MIDFKIQIKEYLELEKLVISSLNMDELNIVMNKILETYENEGFIYIFGNGGSSSTASHFVNDFNKGISEKLSKRFKFVCLNDNVSTVMAVANDNGFEEVFRFQLKNYLTSKDLVIGISGSGNSPNVVNAIQYANEIGAHTVGLVGYSGGIVKNIAKYSVHVNIDNMQIVEDIHMIIDHMMMSIFKRILENSI